MNIKNKPYRFKNSSIFKRFKPIHFFIVLSSWLAVFIVAVMQHVVLLDYSFEELKIPMFIFPSFVGLTFGLLLSRILIFRQLEKEYALAMAKREEEAKYRHLIENSGDAIYLLYDRHFEIINTKFTELFGITIEQANAPEFDFISLAAPESRPFIEERMRLQAEGKKLDPKYEFKAINAKGRTIIVEASVTHIKYKQGVAAKGIIRDLTERRRLEQQLRQSQKMESIGTLAGGVAHDFNNLLTVINGYSEMALLNLDKENSLFKPLEAISQAGKRAANLTGQLLAFSRKQVYRSEILDLNSVIRDMDKILRRLIGEDISIDTILGENLPKIKADKSQLEQIFMNLVVNARDAVYAVSQPDHKKKITIETGTVILDDEYTAKNPGSSQGEHIFISVSDNGMGMEDDIKQKIFEPFYTTKDKSKGTGLGLATVYGIVKQNKGSIFVYSEPGEGTVFKINWPVSTGESAFKAEKAAAFKDISGDESILLVEDDQSVCEYAADALISLGYKVCKAPNGKEALEQINSDKCKLDLIVTDLIMPELNGREFIEQAKKIIPEVKVIYVSGYTDNHIVNNGLLEKGINFVQKPYTVKTLGKKIRQVLDGV